ncbi:Na+/H+ antiporter subunit E [Thiorhodovibrio winogradskyi]
MGVDWVLGLAAAIAATLLSLRLLPPGPGTVRPWPLLKYVRRFMTQSFVGGVDVACRALDPRSVSQPGLISHRTRLRPGPRRTLFGALTSQIPGSVALGSDQPDEMLYHCLDPSPSAARDLVENEALFLAIRATDHAEQQESCP